MVVYMTSCIFFLPDGLLVFHNNAAAGLKLSLQGREILPANVDKNKIPSSGNFMVSVISYCESYVKSYSCQHCVTQMQHDDCKLLNFTAIIFRVDKPFSRCK
jgi:hypothetical protein